MNKVGNYKKLVFLLSVTILLCLNGCTGTGVMSIGNYNEQLGGECITPIILDFDEDATGSILSAGAILTDQFADWGITISAEAKNGDPMSAIVFDSENPTGEDWDLETPGDGPGNDEAMGNVLIIAENLDDENADGLVDDPDDNASGGRLILDFDAPTIVYSIALLDIDSNEDVTVELDGDEYVVPALGDNSLQTLEFEERTATQIVVNLDHSGAIDNLELCLNSSGSKWD